MGEAKAALVRMRCHKAGISFGCCRSRATVSEPARIAAPVNVATTATLGPRWVRKVAPASAPMVAAVTIWPWVILVSMSISRASEAPV